MGQETSLFGALLFALIQVLVTQLANRVRMRAISVDRTVQLSWPRWTIAMHWTAAVMWSALAAIVIAMGLLVIETGHWLASIWAAVFGLLFLGLAAWSIRLSRRKIVLDEIGIHERTGGRAVNVLWNEASVSTWAKITGVLITNGRGKEIIIPFNADGLHLVDDAIRQHVPEGRMALSKAEDGKGHLFGTGRPETRS